METNVNAWKIIAVRIMSQHKIYIEVIKIIGPYIKFQLETPIERNWFMQIVKRNFLKIMESIPIENIEPLSFVINEKYNPNHIENFDIYEVTPPKESDRINFKNIEVKSENKKEEDLFFAKVKNNLSPDILPPSTIFVNPKPEGFGEIEPIPQTTNEENYKVVEVENIDQKLTWGVFFEKKGYSVYIRTKKDNKGKFLFHDIYFKSSLREIIDLKNKSYFIRYKFQPCKDKKRKFQIFKEYPDPE